MGLYIDGTETDKMEKIALGRLDLPLSTTVNQQSQGNTFKLQTTFALCR